MNLKSYLRMTGISQAEFANMISINQSTVSLYCSLRRIPRKNVLERIKRVTNGRVTDFSNKNSSLKQKESKTLYSVIKIILKKVSD